jgi:hypothetical protein
MPDAENGQDPNTPIKTPSKDRGWIWFISYVKREMHERHAKKQEESTVDRAARHTANATIWLAVFTVILAATSLGTVWILKNQLKEMHDGGIDTHALAEASGNQAKAARDFAISSDSINSEINDAESDFAKMAKNSEGSIKATQEAMRQDQRAWIGMMQVTGIPEVGKPFHAAIALANTGKTPAIDFVVQERLIPLNESDKFSPDWNAKATGIHSRAVLFPNQIFNSVVKGSEKEVVVDQATLDTIVNTGKVKAYVFGRACYRDVFKRRHWLHFCDVYDPEGKTYIACAEYNEVDTDKNAKTESCELPKNPS